MTDQARGVVEEIDRYLVETNDYVGLLQRARDDLVTHRYLLAENSKRISALESQLARVQNAHNELVAALREIIELREAMVPVQPAELDACANIARAALKRAEGA